MFLSLQISPIYGRLLEENYTKRGELMELIQQYQRLGLSEALFSRGEAVLAALEDRFKAIDQDRKSVV